MGVRGVPLAAAGGWVMVFALSVRETVLPVLGLGALAPLMVTGRYRSLLLTLPALIWGVHAAQGWLPDRFSHIDPGERPELSVENL